MEQVMRYIESDVNLVNGIGGRISFQGIKEEKGKGLDGGVAYEPDDNAVMFIEFQFPFKVTSDSRKADWAKTETPKQSEPIVMYASSQAREFTLQWIYIYDGNEKGDWGVERITTQIRRLRGYFQRVKFLKASREMVAYVQMYAIGGPKPISCRMMSVDVKYSDTMIWEPGVQIDRDVKGRHAVNDHDHAYPMKTEVTATFAVWTTGAGTLNDKKERVDQAVNGLVLAQPVEWY
jgi:hypothetical protein